MNELKQILKWGGWSLFGLVVLPLLILSVASSCCVKCCLLPYIGIAYLLLLLSVITLMIICVVGLQRRLNQEKEHELQQEALKDKFARESEKIAYDKEERMRKWNLEDEDRERKFKLEDEERARKFKSEDEARKFKLEDEDRAREITIEDEDRKRKWKLEDEDRANAKSKETK